MLNLKKMIHMFHDDSQTMPFNDLLVSTTSLWLNGGNNAYTIHQTLLVYLNIYRTDMLLRNFSIHI